jgi:hypothetical protein
MALRAQTFIPVATLQPVQWIGPVLPYSEQLLTQWCWAACVEMVMKMAESQCDVASRRLAPLHCCTGKPNPCDGNWLPGKANDDECNRPVDVAKIEELWAWYLGAGPQRSYPAVLPKDDLVDELQDGRAVQPRVWLTMQRSWHVILVVGYDGHDRFRVYDPCFAGIVNVTYDALKNYQGAWEWKTTFWKLS